MVKSGWLNRCKGLGAAVLAVLALSLAVPAEARAVRKSPSVSKAQNAAVKRAAVKRVVGKRPTTKAHVLAARVGPRIKPPRNVRLKLRAAAPVHQAAVVYAAPSYGQAYGLHEVADPLELKSSVALVVDQESNEVLVAKNARAVLPIASLTKLMTALVVVESGQRMNDLLTVTEEDVDTEKGSRSRLRVGATLTRDDMLHLALMSSENRAANALGRHYPGGLQAFVQAMNAKARALGMNSSHFSEPTGLSNLNQSSAADLAVLVKAVYRHRTLREMSVSPAASVPVGDAQVQFHNTNRLISNPNWDIGLQKTGYIAEAGRCLVMQTRMAGRKLIMVFLDSAGKYSRLGDAERVRQWLGNGATALVPVIAGTPLVNRP